MDYLILLAILHENRFDKKELAMWSKMCPKK